MKVFVVFLSLLVFAREVKGQESDSMLQVYYTKAKEQIASQDFKSAHTYFKKIFSLKTTMPDEVAYHYGLTLVRLKYYQKGKEALEKYRELSGNDGVYYEDAGKLIAESNKFICLKCNNSGTAEITDTCVVCHGSGIIAADCDFCQAKGIEYCTICGGQGVMISQGNFGNKYSTCKKCSGKGYYDCPVCNGTKKKTSYCTDCKGKGFFKRKISCSH